MIKHSRDVLFSGDDRPERGDVVDAQFGDRPATIDATRLLTAPYQPPEFLIEHLVPKNAITLLSADTGGGKSSFLLHCALSLALSLPVAGRFGVPADAGPTLYLNGEMSPDTLARFLHANLAGIGVTPEDLPEGRLIFDGHNGFANFFLTNDGYDATVRLERLVRVHQPSVVVFDTYRALFEADEAKVGDVARVFEWLRKLTVDHGCSIIVAHHVRKLSPISNAARERVSGSRYLIGSVDVHLAMKSPSGQPVTSLLIDKTRAPFAGVSAGTEFPMEARWIDAEPPQSRFEAGDPSAQSASTIEAAQEEILELLEAEGPKTVAELDARSGSRKRALEVLRKSGDVVENGKRGRAMLLGLRVR